MKAIYKVFDKSTGKYITGQRSKSAWTSRVWAIEAGKAYAIYMVTRFGAWEFRKQEALKYMQKFLELHEIPPQNPIITSLATAAQEETQAKKEQNNGEYKLMITELEIQLAKITKQLESLKFLYHQ